MDKIKKLKLEDAFFETALVKCKGYNKENDVFLKIKGFNKNYVYIHFPTIKIK